MTKHDACNLTLQEEPFVLKEGGDALRNQGSML